MLPAFVTTAVAKSFRACATKVSVERVTERSATLIWTSAARASFIVHYGPKGAPFLSRRTVAHPRVDLHGLRPATPYDARVVGPGVDTLVSFSTPVASTIDESVPSGFTASDSSTNAAASLTELSRLEIRVGKIVECEPHPDADTLYVEKVDVGEPDGPRTIVSGLVNYVSLDDMIGRNVIVLCNLKPRTMRGVTSYGMLLCASNEDHTKVDPLAAPDGAHLGELVTFEGHRADPIDAGNRATKAFDRIADSLHTDENGIAMFKDVPFNTSAGACVSPNKLVGPVS